MCIRDSIYCVHHELDGKSFYDEYCEGYAHSNEEDGMINAGYAVWRECIAEIIAIECDDNCDIFPIRDKKKMLAQLRDEIDQRDGKPVSYTHLDVYKRQDSNHADAFTSSSGTASSDSTVEGCVSSLSSLSDAPPVS